MVNVGNIPYMDAVGYTNLLMIAHIIYIIFEVELDRCWQVCHQVTKYLDWETQTT